MPQQKPPPDNGEPVVHDSKAFFAYTKPKEYPRWNTVFDEGELAVLDNCMKLRKGFADTKLASFGTREEIEKSFKITSQETPSKARRYEAGKIRSNGEVQPVLILDVQDSPQPTAITITNLALHGVGLTFYEHFWGKKGDSKMKPHDVGTH